MRTKVYGPPGTGKTTYLIGIIEAYLREGGDLREVCFLSFSRNAVSEILSRLQHRFPNLPKGHFLWFRTLHSLSYFLAGVRQSTSELFSGYKFLEFLRKAGYVDEHRPYEEVKRETDTYLTMMTFLRRRQITEGSVQEANVIEQQPFVEAFQFKQFRHLYNTYKRKQRFVDFTDVLEQAIKVPRYPLSFKLLLVDEAQDLCPLQWRIVERLCGLSERVYIAGDDDQSIYQFSGSIADGFLDFPCDEEVVLQQSYRIPMAVHTLSEKVIRRVSRRKDKVFSPREAEGQVIFTDNVLSAIRENEGASILLLTQCTMEGAEYFRQLNEAQVASHYAPFGFDSDFFQNLNELVAFRRGESNRLKFSVARWVLSLNPENKSYLEALLQMPRCAIEKHEDFGVLLRTVKMSVLMIPKKTYQRSKIVVEEWMFEAWLRNYLERGTTEPLLRISTPFREKGSEAHCVIVDLSYGRLAHEQLQYDPDSLHRSFYVAITRAKHKLYLVPSNASAYRSYSIHNGVS